MTNREAIDAIKANYPPENYTILREALDKAIVLLKEHETVIWIKISPAGIYECSGCGQNVMTSDIDAYKYCHGCGKEVKWE